MNRLELVVLDRHAHERIDVGRLAHEVRPVVELLEQQLLADRRRVDDLSAHAAFQRRSRFRSNIQLYPFDSTAYLYSHIRRQHAPLDHFRALVERRAVAQGLLGGRIGTILGDIRELEQLVRGRDDVLDFAARPRLEQGQGVDENGGIRDQFGGLLEFGQGDAGRDAAFEYLGCFDQLEWRRQFRKIVVGFFWIKFSHLQSTSAFRWTCRQDRQVA